MKIVQQFLFAVLISLTLTLSGGTVAQAQDWQNQKPPEKPVERDKDKPKDDKKEEKKGEKKKP